MAYIFNANTYPLSNGKRLIEASAGTGKTFAIAHLVLRLITEREYAINDILVVTFTEAAAAELKSRIAIRIETALEGIQAISNGKEFNSPDEILQDWLITYSKDKSIRLKIIQSLLSALDSIDSADITTIHGFAKRTIWREALYSNAPINPKLETESTEIVSEVIYDYWNRNLLLLNHNDLKGLQIAGITFENLVQYLNRIDSDVSMKFEVNLDPFSLEEPLNLSFNQYISKKWRIFLEYWQKYGVNLEESIKEQAKIWKEQGYKETTPFSPKPRKNRALLLSDWIDSEQATTNNSLKRPSYANIRSQDLLSNYFHPGVFAKLSSQFLEEDAELLQPSLQRAIAKLYDGPAEMVLKHSLCWSSRKLAERRKKLGFITYGGLLSSLEPENRSKDQKEKEFLINKLSNRYKAALIDEFQDSDSLQWRILKDIFGNEKQHLLLMVGDPKQAIYKFRGGELNTYLTAKKEVNRIDELTDNYRAERSLMEGLNALMAEGLTRSNLKVSPLHPCSNGQSIPLNQKGDSLELINLDHLEGGSIRGTTSKSELEKLIPKIITNRILNLLNKGIEVSNPSDICILVNRHDQAADIRESLARGGIPTRLVHKGDVLRSEAGTILQRFLDCLAKPGDSSSIRLVACSPLMQWDLETLHNSDTNGELDKISMRFKNWIEQFPEIGLIGCLNELLDGQTIAYLSKRDRLLVDLYQGAEIVQQEIHTQGLDPLSASKWLKRQRLQPSETIPDNRQPQSDIAESSVNVLTIHRSKGLEYKVVICPYLWERPPETKGPLWRCEETKSWVIALNRSWGKGKKMLARETQESFQEAERLAYVALTRARTKLILLWARGINQEGNPLVPLLFGPSEISSKISSLTPKYMHDWLTKKNIRIKMKIANTKEIDRAWEPAIPNGELGLGPVPTREMDTTWGRNSYSKWTKSNQGNNAYLYNPLLIEEGKEEEKESVVSLKEVKRSADLRQQNSSQEKLKIGPLASFPRGAQAGDCLHKILERIDFNLDVDSNDSKKIIEEELRRAGIDMNFIKPVQKGLYRLLNTPLGGELGELRLKELTSQQRIHELNFDLPIAHKGNRIQSNDIAKAFRIEGLEPFGKDYSEEVSKLRFISRGFLTGSIDMVFPDSKNLSEAKWWVVDWKSNWLGEEDSLGVIKSCGPIDYTKEAMESQMITHHYPLQAHIYLLALHRFLKWRLKGYLQEKNLGGYIYIFVRGIGREPQQRDASSLQDMSGIIIQKAPLKRIAYLDSLMKEGGG